MNEPVHITFVRTSTVIIEHAGRRLITDPWFARTMRGLPVFRRPGVALDALGRVDYVLASHLHRDHFDRSALQVILHPELAVCGPRGTAALSGAAAHELSPWQELPLGPFAITATPAEHTGPPPREVNYLIDCGGQRIFFGGDARFSLAFAEVAERLPRPDVAILPIGGTLIFGHRTTMSPRDAVRACAVLRPRWAVPIHEGGEWLSVPPASLHPGRCRHFAAELDASRVDTRPCLIAPGETVTFRGGEPVRRSAWAHRGLRR